jgi:hypothetical protein
MHTLSVRRVFIIMSLFLCTGAGCNIVTGPGTALPSKSARTVTNLVPSKQVATVAQKTSVAAISPVKIVPVVEKYLSEHLITPKSGGKVFSSFYVYGQEERDNELYYYIWAVVREYVKNGSSIQIANGVSLPLLVVLGRDADGVYSRVLGYRQAGALSDGAAIQEIFPLNIRQIIANSLEDHARRLDLLERETITKAREFYVLGGPVSIAQIQTQQCTNYRFENYTDLTPFSGNYRDFSMPSFALSSSKIRSAINNAYNNGYAFAGRFGIASWSCGVNCLEHIVVDTNRGTVVGSPFRADYGLEFKQDSRLLVVNPYRNILKPNVKVTTSYLLLHDGVVPGLTTLCSFTPNAASTTPVFIGSGNTNDAIRRYFSNATNECLSLRIQCNSGERYFSDDSGCGCEASGSIE